MNVTYKGRQKQFTDAEQKKINVRFSKLAKLVDKKGEKVAHVALTATRHLHKAELTMNLRDHPVAGVGTASDEVQAIIEATERVEKQIQKLREKWRDGKRGPAVKKAKESVIAGVVSEATEDESAISAKIFRVQSNGRKPMTLDEAMLELGGNDRDYLAYRDAESDKFAVLIRRKDGHFDLIEA